MGSAVGRVRRVLPPAKKASVWFLLSLPGVLSLLTDSWHRAGHLWNMPLRYQALYVLAAVESCIVWGLLLYSAGRRSWAGNVLSVLFVVAFTAALGGQVYFFEQYHAYLTQDLTLFAANLTESVVNQLAADIGHYFATNVPFLVIAVTLVMACRSLFVNRGVHPRRRLVVLAPLVFIGCWFVPLKFRAPQAATPDTLYLNAMGAYVRSRLGVTDQSRQVRPRVRQSRPVPSLNVVVDDEGSKQRTPTTTERSRHGGRFTSAVPAARNVLFVIGESLRADATCVRYDPDCKLTPYTNDLLRDRQPLTQLRALDSTTAISVAVLFSGVAPTESSDVLHTWPLLFDYAKAAGRTTAYWTSQNLFFASSHLFVENLGVDDFVSATQLDMNADIDVGADEALLADYVIEHFPKMREPFFGVLHLSNVHYPYLVRDHGEKPFQPAALDKGPNGNKLLRNYYQNAIVQQDLQLARIIEEIRQTEAGRRTIIIYTSDHGEAFRDHYQMGHTFSLFDEEVKVPAFIDAPPGTVSETERANLRAHEDRFTFHPDLTATALDLMGVWNSPAIDEFRENLIGRSLIAAPEPDRTMPMTNCSAVWSCAFENWGVMHGHMKVFARTPYDSGWQCYDLLQDPAEQVELTTPRCNELVAEALSLHGRPPM